jgi:hypothetical protein
MFTWLIIFVAVGSVIGYFVKDGKRGAAEGAVSGFAAFMVFATSVLVPLFIVVMLFRACS